MNWQHFQAFLWLRWRLLLNQLKRGGIANVVVLAILAGGAVCLSICLFVGFFLVGIFLLPEATPAVLMYIWDGLVVLFLFVWCIGLLAELQRSEVLSLEKFLYLPVSLTGVFLINYASSLFSLSLLLALPAMLALSLALVFAKGPAMLLLLPLLAAFLLMVTGVSYQFQGWLASLMVNKRRRRTVLVVVTLVFVLLCQAPQLIHFFRPWKNGGPDDFSRRMRNEQEALKVDLDAKKITAEEYHQRLLKTQQNKKKRTEEAEQQLLDQIESVARIVNVVFPPGWLPLGVLAAAEGNLGLSLACTLGLTLLGTASLWRAYQTTLRLYLGQFTAGSKRPRTADATTATPTDSTAPGLTTKTKLPANNLLEMHLPWVSEPCAAVALSTFRSLLRAPEAKMMLLGPILMMLVFGSLLWAQAGELPELLRPLAAFGAMVMILFFLGQLLINQFGFDRSGFRVFVLCAASRRDILLGKNLAMLPLTLGLSLFLVTLLQVFCPMRIDYLLATFPQFLTMYLLFCLLANGLSIYVPMAIASGTLKPVNPKFIPILIQFLVLTMAYPLTLIPTVLPLGLGLALDALNMSQGFPVCLILSLVVCVGAFFVYRWVLTWQGEWLQEREQKILETVATKTE